MTSPEFAFATNLTPNNYEDEHTAVDMGEQQPPIALPSLPIRFLDSASQQVLTADGTQVVPQPSAYQREPRRKRKSDDPGHIPRPPNAFILFRIDFVKRGRLPGNLETHASLSKMASEKWRALTPPERAYWDAQAEIERRAHRLKYPQFDTKQYANKAKAEKRKPAPPPKPRHISVPHRDLPPDLPPQPRARPGAQLAATAQQSMPNSQPHPEQWQQEGVFMTNNWQDAVLQKQLVEVQCGKHQRRYPPVPPPGDLGTPMDEDGGNPFEKSDFDYYYERMINAQASLAVSVGPQMPPPPLPLPPPMDVDMDVSEASTPSLESDHPQEWAKQEEPTTVHLPPPPPPKPCLARTREAAFPYSYFAESKPDDDTGFEVVSPIYQRLVGAKEPSKETTPQPMAT
ncbi:uncharacterized protein SCHCODRAFT_01211684 [Schizophyllum commune H4-8]|uniref:HMG box domain-containing protein n=1 Tax=Schizophyllum commune (strain H4-8 / FGSC 9210) TaxID=578458 RepID=D8Q1Q5_SCHCM|nr:uncharacterized protein SCHCODRAFT_01211684 [Schizophyllum commune H4-8]KAI5895525.1 hypothetical protein SCHCODRAFT_01211684 [Schizophyllum commune H4-8]